MRKLPHDFNITTKNGLLHVHESAIKHVTGQAVYIDDMPEWPNELFVATGLSTEAHADIVSINLDKVRAYPGVVDVIVQADIPGEVDVSPVLSGDLLLAGDFVHFIGQAVFAVAATSLRAAKQAVALAEIEYKPREATLHPRQSLERQEFVLPTHTISCGDAETALVKAPNTLKSDLYIKGQEHFYLEGQISVAVPNEDGGVQVYASSQHPAEVQKLVARVLGLPVAQVLVEVRRMGGGFGGKESQAAVLSCMAAVLAVRNGCPVKYRMPRQDDMVQTGKRANVMIFGTATKWAFPMKGRYSQRNTTWWANVVVQPICRTVSWIVLCFMRTTLTSCQMLESAVIEVKLIRFPIQPSVALVALKA